MAFSTIQYQMLLKYKIYKFCLFTALLWFGAGIVSAQLPKRNIVANSNFEEGLKHWRWDNLTNNNAVLSVEKNNPISGNQSAKIEEYAVYKIIFTVKADRDNVRFKVELCESYDNLTDFKPLELESWDDDFIVENKDAAIHDLRGTVLAGTQARTYEFITKGNQFAYPLYI